MIGLFCFLHNKIYQKQHTTYCVIIAEPFWFYVFSWVVASLILFQAGIKKKQTHLLVTHLPVTGELTLSGNTSGLL